MLKRIIKISVWGLISLWLVFCLSVYFYPKAYFYNPSNEKPDIKEAQAEGFFAQEVKYKSDDNTELYGWFVKPKNDKVIVFFHGNSHNIARFYSKLIPLAQSGYGIFIGEYRGFGGIKGEITEKNLGEDAIAAVKYLNLQGYENSKLILYGMSMGSYTSIHTAYTLGKENKFLSLILEVPFDSVLNVVKQRIVNLFPFSLIIRDKYDNTSSTQKT